MAKKTWTRIPASLSGMKPEDIPSAPGVDVDLIKQGDDDPLEVVVEIPAGKSTKGWNYKASALKDIVDEVNANTLAGILGHQRPENLASEFAEPVTHWVGAKMVGETAYFRGVIDADAAKLKRWIRSKRIKQVSIFGFPELSQVSGETQVLHYKPLSIDWTPLDRSGMPTRIVALGEMDDPADPEGGTTVNIQELIAQLLALISGGTANLQEVLTQLDPQGTQQATANAELIGKLKAALGVTEDSELLPAAEKAAQAMQDAASASQANLAQQTVKEKVQGEMAQALVLRLLKTEPGASKEVIVGEIDGLLADNQVQEMISRIHTDSFTLSGGSGLGGQASTAKHTRRASI